MQARDICRYIHIYIHKVSAFRECAINDKPSVCKEILQDCSFYTFVLTIHYFVFICPLLLSPLFNYKVMLEVVSYKILVALMVDKKELTIKSCVYRFLLW